MTTTPNANSSSWSERFEYHLGQALLAAGGTLPVSNSSSWYSRIEGLLQGIAENITQVDLSSPGPIGEGQPSTGRFTSISLPGLTLNSNGVIQTTGVGAGSVAGNARGSGAVDLQTIRFSASRVASGTQSVVVGGQDNQASATWSSVVGGVGNQATGFASSIIGGENNQATAQYGVILSGMWGLANKFGQQAQSPGRFSVQGDAQRSSLTAYGSTTNATPTDIFLDNGSARCTLANNQALRFTVDVIAKQVNSTNHASFRIEGTIVRGANAASTTLGATNKTTILNGQSWDFNVSADTTNGALRLTATGAAATNIRWVASIDLVEVI